MALAIAALNAVLPPLLAALRLPFTVALGFILVLVLNALVLKSEAISSTARTSSTASAGRCSLRWSWPRSASCSR